MVLSQKAIEKNEAALRRLQAITTCYERQKHRCVHKANYSCETCSLEDQLGSLEEQCEALKHCLFLVNEYIKNEKSLLEYLSKKHDTEV